MCVCDACVRGQVHELQECLSPAEREAAAARLRDTPPERGSGHKQGLDVAGEGRSTARVEGRGGSAVGEQEGEGRLEREGGPQDLLGIRGEGAVPRPTRDDRAAAEVCVCVCVFDRCVLQDSHA